MKNIFKYLLALMLVLSMSNISVMAVEETTNEESGNSITIGEISYDSIQEAIDAAEEGATIIVGAGTYEEDLLINKSIILQGANVGINPNNSDWSLAVRGSETIYTGVITASKDVKNIEIDGFKFTKSEDDSGGALDFLAGGYEKVKVINNIADSTYYGSGFMYVSGQRSQDVEFVNNRLIDTHGNNSAGTSGVLIWNTDNIKVNGNYFYRTDNTTGMTSSAALNLLGQNGVVELKDNYFEDMIIKFDGTNFSADEISGNFFTGRNGRSNILEFTTIRTLEEVEFLKDNNTYSPEGLGYVAYGRPARIGNIGYASIQTAISEAKDGETILVGPGNITENIIIDKKITLKAVNLGEATVSGTVQVTSDDVTIENLILEVDSGGYVVELVNVNNILVTNNIIRNKGDGYGSLVTSTGPAHATGEISNNTFKGALVVGSNGELKIIDNKIETNTGSGEAIALYPATATSEFVVENNELTLLEDKGGIKVQPLIVDTKPVGISINGLSDDLDIMLSLMTTNDILLKDVDLTWNNDVIYVVDFMFDDELLKRELVVSGKEATAPTAPTRDGHTFNGWNATFTNVTSDLTIVATYLSKVVEAETKDFPKLEVEGLDDLDKLGITFTDEEKEKDVSVILVLELQKDEDVPKADKDLLDAYLEANANIDSPMSLLLDISMLKIVGDSASAINELASPITISFEIPFAFRNIDFELLRVHDGKVESLDYDYNAETFILTFETDKFSTYALAEVAEESEKETLVPDMSDNGFRNIAYVSMLLGSLLVLLGSKRKLFAKLTK